MFTISNGKIVTIQGCHPTLIDVAGRSDGSRLGKYNWCCTTCVVQMPTGPVRTGYGASPDPPLPDKDREDAALRTRLAALKARLNEAEQAATSKVSVSEGRLASIATASSKVDSPVTGG